MKFITSPRFLRHSLIILFTTVAILYIGFHGQYTAEYLDDAWVLSWAWNLYEHGEILDTVFGSQHGGTVYFQRTLAIIYGAVASVLGWSKGVAYGVSKAFVIMAATCWFFIIQKLGYRRLTALTFVGIMLLLEAYLGIANKIRPEPIALFLCSASLLLFINKRYLFSGLLLGIAVETHPFAYIGLFWVLAYLVVLWPKMRTEAKKYIVRSIAYMAGLAIGFVYWLLLHSVSLSDVAVLTGKIAGNVFESYFFKNRYAWRHWPELGMIVFATVLFIVRRKYTTYPFILPFMAAVVLASILMSRGNMHYIVYIYPAAILLLVTMAEDFKMIPVLVLALLLFQLPQYVWLFWHQKDYNHREFLHRLNQSVPENDELIYGNPDAWFMFQERDFHAYGYFNRTGIAPKDWPDSFIVIETPDFNRWYGQADLIRGENLYSREDIAQWTYWNGEPVEIYRLIRSANSMPPDFGNSIEESP